jgi:cyclopropane fatty-acyl-phospholipid synthase-like methyltransferase
LYGENKPICQSLKARTMKPATDANTDYKDLVRRGYDACAAEYEAARRAEANPELELIIARLPAEAAVLDLGCGAGVPVARTLARHARVTGVDISTEQIRRAQANVPEGTFIQDDLMRVDLPAETYDAAVAYYSLFHLPREEHRAFFRRLHGWLKPGGHALLTVTRQAEAAYTEDDFFGVTMYWSNWGLGEYRQMLTEAGFEVLATGTVGHGYVEETGAAEEWHPYLFVQKAVTKQAGEP